MKKCFILLSSLTILLACSNSSNTAHTTENTSTKSVDPAVEKGLSLVAKSDCFTCHKVAEPFTGPSYEAIAAKYPDTEENMLSLAQKIIKGGAGNWGTVPMTPHNDISPDDARLMVLYIISLK